MPSLLVQWNVLQLSPDFLGHHTDSALPSRFSRSKWFHLYLESSLYPHVIVACYFIDMRGSFTGYYTVDNDSELFLLPLKYSSSWMRRLSLISLTRQSKVYCIKIIPICGGISLAYSTLNLPRFATELQLIYLTFASTTAERQPVQISRPCCP